MRRSVDDLAVASATLDQPVPRILALASHLGHAKSEPTKKHPPAMLDRLRKALDGAENEAAESDWGECMDHVAAARKALRTKR